MKDEVLRRATASFLKATRAAECGAVPGGTHRNDKKAVNLGVAAHITAARKKR